MYITGTYIKPNIIISYVPPFTIIQPVGAIIPKGYDYTFRVEAIGTPPFAYKWYKNGVLLETETQNYLTIINATETDTANYYCVISNNSYSTQSDTVELLVLDKLFIVTQPVSINTNPNTTVFFNTSAIGATPITYDWYKNGELISSSYNNLLYTFNTQTKDIGNYYCVISNLVDSVTTNTVELTLNTPLVVVRFPDDTTINPGQTVNTSLSCTGTTPITAQWRKNGSNFKSSNVYNNGFVPLVISDVEKDDNGVYDCVLTNIVGSITSQSFLLYVGESLGFTTQPISGTVNVEESFTFTADASGSEPIYYQWIKTNPYFNLGVTGKTLTLNNIEVTDQSNYACVVTNAVGSLTSSVVPLSVISDYIITNDGTYITFNDNVFWKYVNKTDNNSYLITNNGDFIVFDTEIYWNIN